MKFPRRATVCKPSVKKNNGWIKIEASPPSTLKTIPVMLLMQGEAKPRVCPPPPLLFRLSFLLLHLEPNVNQSPRF